MTDPDAADAPGIEEISVHPIVELLCLCSGPNFDEQRARRAQEIVVEFDSEEASEAAIQHHRVSSLVADRLGDLEGVSSELFKSLEEHSHQLALTNLGLARDLLELLEQFEEAGIPAIPFKGPVLAAQIYDDLRRRQFSDLDVMVPADRIEEAKRTMTTAGYVSEHNFTPVEWSIYREGEHALEYHRGSTHVELQWQLSHPHFAVPIDYEWLDAHRTGIELAGRTVPSLAAEPLLLLLCIHGTKHRWKRLKWLSDLAFLLQRSRLDWELVETEAERMGRTRHLYLGALLAAELLDAPVPDAVLSAGRRSNAVLRLRDRVISRSLTPTGEERGPPRILLFQYLSLDRHRDRREFLARFLSQPEVADVRAMPFPQSLTGASIAIRPFRLMTKLVQYLVKNRLRS